MFVMGAFIFTIVINEKWLSGIQKLVINIIDKFYCCGDTNKFEAIEQNKYDTFDIRLEQMVLYEIMIYTQYCSAHDQKEEQRNKVCI